MRPSGNRRCTAWLAAGRAFRARGRTGSTWAWGRSSISPSCAPSRHGPWVQVSRLGNPLFNEVIVPLGKKDRWNRLYPAHDKAFLSYVQHPEVAKLLPVLYPNVFTSLAGLSAPRADLVAILLTGLPPGV